MPDRPLRLCDICGGLDDHPRHVYALAHDEANVPSAEFLDSIGDVPASALAQLLSPVTRIRHMDCCAADGCPICQATETELGAIRGQELIDALLGGALEDFVAPTESESSNG